MCLELKIDSELQTAKKDITVYKWLKTSINPYYHGKEFTGIIKGIECEGKIFINKDMRVYFCTNNPYLDGASTSDKLGYEYSWRLNYRVESIKVDGVEIIKDGKVLDEFLTQLYFTPYQKTTVEIGKTYESELIREDYKVHIGLHSFQRLKDAKNDGYGVFVKCIIPKGSKYYKGSYDGAVSYASDKLTYIEIVE